MTAEELARILDTLGERLGPTGEYVWGLAVRYALTDAIVWLLVGIGTLGIAGGATIALIRVRRTADDFDRDLVTIFGGAGVIAILLLGLYLTSANLVTILNPEYAAIRNLLEGVMR